MTGATFPLMVSLVNMAGTREVKKRHLAGGSGTSPARPVPGSSGHEPKIGPNLRRRACYDICTADHAAARPDVYELLMNDLGP